MKLKKYIIYPTNVIGHNYKNQKNYTEHIRNNTDKVETGHEICSFILSRSPCLSHNKLKNKLMAIDNKLLQFLTELLKDKDKHESLIFLFKQLDKVNVSKIKRKIQHQRQILNTKKAEYLHKGLKKRRKQRQTKRKNKRSFTEFSTANPTDNSDVIPLIDMDAMIGNSTNALRPSYNLMPPSIESHVNSIDKSITDVNTFRNDAINTNSNPIHLLSSNTNSSSTIPSEIPNTNDVNHNI